MFPVHRPAPQGPPPDVSAQVPPDRLEQHELLRLGQAANRARALYPGIVGDTLADALTFERDTKLRFVAGSKVHELVRHLMTTPVPPDPA